MNRFYLIAKTFFFLLILLTNNVKSATYTVTNTNDNGEGSLRQAMTQATSNFMGGSNIVFDIPLSDPNYNASDGTFTIHPLSELPYLLIGGNNVIDATTQAANHGDTNPYGPEIVIDGGTLSLPTCFRIASQNNTIKGFNIVGFQYAILFFGGNGTVADCYIGVIANAQGVSDSHTDYGIGISGGSYGGYNLGYSHDVTIRNNIIGGCTVAGIALVGVNDNTITQNKIGNNGNIPLPNNQGIYLTSASSNNTFSDNVVSGNENAGMVLESTGTNNNVIVGNKIGVNTYGNAPLSNHYGIIVMTNANSNQIGGPSTSERNIISANLEIGVYIESADSNMVCGNIIGPDITGTQMFEIEPDSLMQANGVEINTTGKHNIIGGDTPSHRNIISGNRVYGCIYYGNCSNNNIKGNYIGTDITGNMALPNATGICVDGSSHNNIMEHNVLSGNRSYGLFIVTQGTDNNVFRGNLVGTNADGTTALPNDVGLMLAATAKGNIIGGDTDDERNIFSGNTYAGIEVTDNDTRNNKIKGNYIGTDITGNAPLPNENGIIVSALVKELDISNNVVAANNRFGIVITDQADSIRIENNNIGIGTDSTTPLGNSACGVLLGNGASNCNICGNIIAHNDTAGIMLMDETTLNNRITQNSIFGNRYAGTDIFPWGINENDPGDTDDGCNHLMNYPVIELVEYNPATQRTHIKGHLDTQNPQNATIELFIADDDNIFGLVRQGKTFIASTHPDSNGDWSINTSNVSSGTEITATATDADGNTSEFSAICTTVESVKENENPQITISPNPTYGLLNVTANSGLETCSIKLVDATGKSASLKLVNRSEKGIYVDITNNKSGVYVLEIVFPQGEKTSAQIIKL